ncbi:MAG: nucleotidyl transferase AbiEii/AbiGii toxin family protein [Chloroflexi bacterium]|nr:nucleotidyl transferase AbiEii/AbiGii toxin family protein [Chloroflexota bacterium]
MLKGKGTLLPSQKAFLDIFSKLPDQSQFYLTGGTALSEFYLGHRLSFDLDFFTNQEGLIRPFSHQIEAECKSQGVNISIVRRFETFAQLIFEHEGESLKIDLAFDSPFRLQPTLSSKYGVQVNNFEDLKADKILAFFGRAEPRDAVDLFFFLKQETLDELLPLAAEKDPGFDLYWFAIALKRANSYPDELQRWQVKMLETFSPQELKAQFTQMAMEIMAELTNS